MMIRTTIALDEVIDYLNELIETDRPAMAALIANRVPCNPAMANHPTVQVQAQHGGYLVGMLGILNGLFGTFEDGWGPIVFVFKDGNLLGVEESGRFEAEKMLKDGKLPVNT
jgi:hypothetical protein